MTTSRPRRYQVGLAWHLAQRNGIGFMALVSMIMGEHCRAKQCFARQREGHPPLGSHKNSRNRQRWLIYFHEAVEPVLGFGIGGVYLELDI